MSWNHPKLIIDWIFMSDLLLQLKLILTYDMSYYASIIGIRNTCAASGASVFRCVRGKVDNFVIILIGLTRKQ